MPGATLPNTGTVLPSVGGDNGVWGTELNTALTNYDGHDHSSGKGSRIHTAGISLDADLTFSGLYAPTNLNRISFSSIAALSSNNKSLFVNSADNELYWRSNAGTNVKVTSGAALNVAAFTGGIGGDYTAVSAAVAYDDSNKRYTFKEGTLDSNGWARLASGTVRIFETGTTESVFVGLQCPAALGGSYTITWPTALPGSNQPLAVDNTGAITTGTSMAMASNANITLSGSGEIKHGDRVINLPPSVMAASTNVIVDSNGFATSTGSANMVFPITLLQGDRIKSVTFARFGNGTVDLSIDVFKMTSGGVSSSINVSGSVTVTNAAASWNDTVVDVTDTTLGAGDTISMIVFANATGISIGSIRVTYDRP